jgi:ribosomal protein S18 acetylase RimI-like enzyme
VIEVRAATADDAEAIADVNVRSWQHAYRGIVPDSYLDALDRTTIANHVRETALSGSATLLVAGGAGIDGFSCLAPSRDQDAPPQTAEIIAIYVDPARERRGIGRALALASCHAARSQGFTHISLWVIDRNVRARAFYEALEFVLDGRTKTSTQWGGAPIQELRYVRPL